MTGSRSTPRSRRALLLVAIFLMVGGVFVAVGVASLADEGPSDRAGAGASSTLGAGTSARSTDLADMTARPDPPIPVRLEIPAIDVATPLIQLGLMPDRTVEVPSNADRAGWFQPGPGPGQRGSAVILGHVDSPQGPAVFARLQELRPGDAVTVKRADGSTVRFVVSEAVLYANDDFPAERVYAAPDGRRLNLVTCGGTYDSTRGGYQSNLVVYTRRAPAQAD